MPKIHIYSDRYQTIELIGQGTFGQVYKARDTRLNRLVALKILAPYLLGDPDFKEQFQREAQLLAQLDHPHIVRVYDVEVIQEGAYIVMQYVEGRTLAQALAVEKPPWPPERALALLRQVAEALDYAHGQGVLHLDLKPANVLLGEEEHVWLTDFGLARAVAGASRASITQAVRGGTPTYMAPEQAVAVVNAEQPRTEEPRPVPPAADIYALAVVAYELLTGRVPFVGQALAVLHAHVYQQPPRPTLLNEALSQGVEDVLLRGLAKSPEARFPTARDFVGELARAFEVAPRHILSHRVIEAPPLTLGDMKVRSLRDLVQAAYNAWDEAVKTLYDGTLETWLEQIRALGAVQQARQVRGAYGNAEEKERERGLQEFLDWTGYTTEPAVSVQPRVIDFGVEEKGYGYRVRSVLTVQNGGPGLVWGKVRSKVEWLYVVEGEEFFLHAGERHEVLVEVDIDALPNGVTEAKRALVVETSVGSQPVGVRVEVWGPKIEVEPDNLDFGLMGPTDERTLPLLVRNMGEGALEGKATSKERWVHVSPSTFRCAAGRQVRLDVSAKAVETGRLPALVVEARGEVILSTNAGEVRVPVRMERESAHYYRRTRLIVIGALLVALFLLFLGIYAIENSRDASARAATATAQAKVATVQTKTTVATATVQAEVFTIQAESAAATATAETTATTQAETARALAQIALQMEPVRILKWHTDNVLSVAFSPESTFLASGSRDNTVHLWRVADGMPFGSLEGHTDDVTSVVFSPDGILLASGSVDHIVRLWRIRDGHLLRLLKGHMRAVTSVAFSPIGTLIASGSADETVRLWRMADGTLLYVLKGHTGGVTSVAFSPDGALLASGSGDGTVRLWRVADGQPLRTLKGHTNWVWGVAFSPDGTLLASGSRDKTVRLWRVADGALVRTLEGHTDDVNSVAFSPDGTLLASGSNDDTVRLWRVADGALVRTLEGHTDNVNSVAFSPDGALLASGSDDRTVRLWGMPKR